MKKLIITLFIINISVYLFISFVAWDILCIKEIPAMKSKDRFFSSFFFVLLNIVAYTNLKLKSDYENPSKTMLFLLTFAAVVSYLETGNMMYILPIAIGVIGIMIVKK
jgi:hypothetical protein